MKSFVAVFVTILSGILGIYLGAAMNLEGFLGIVFAIATVGGFIITSIEKNKMKRE